MAMLMVARNSSASEDRNATRSTAMVARRYSSDIRATAAISARLALNSLSVVSPSMASNTCPLIRASVRHCAWFSASVPRPMMIMNSGTSGAVSTMISPDTQSVGITKARIASGTNTTSALCGRYPV